MALQQSVGGGLRELALFAGAGGGILGGKPLGWKTVCAVEINDYCRKVLMQRQEDKILDPFPIWDDVRAFNGKPWRGIVDVVSGGFPCTDISAAGKGAGITGKESGLWVEMARIIGEVRPRFAFVENSPVLTSRGLGTVLGDLAEMGYDARWGVVSAADAIWLDGTPCLDHLRERIWIAAADASRVQPGWAHKRAKWERAWTGSQSDGRANGERLEGWISGSVQEYASERAFGAPDSPDAEHSSNGRRKGRKGRPDSVGAGEREQAFQAIPNSEGERGGTGLREDGSISDGDQSADRDSIGREHWWQSEPGVGRVVRRCPHRVDRLKSLGNIQVPRVAALAWSILT